MRKESNLNKSAENDRVNELHNMRTLQGNNRNRKRRNPTIENHITKNSTTFTREKKIPDLLEQFNEGIIIDKNFIREFNSETENIFINQDEIYDSSEKLNLSSDNEIDFEENTKNIKDRKDIKNIKIYKKNDDDEFKDDPYFDIFDETCLIKPDPKIVFFRKRLKIRRPNEFMNKKRERKDN